MVSPADAESMAACISLPAWMLSACAPQERAIERIKAEKSSIAALLPHLGPIVLQPALMPEVAHACEDHGHAVLICGIDHLSIPNGAAGMNYGQRSRLVCLVQAVPEGEE